MASLSAAEDAGILWLATLQRVMARVSHDVKDALNGVSVNLEVIRSRASRPGADAASAAPFADAAAQQLERLTTLIEAVLALGRAEREPVDVAMVLRRVATLCNASSSSTVTVEVNDGAAEMVTLVRGEAVRLALAAPLLELVAAKRSERAGGGASATPATVRCTLSSAADGDAIVVTLDAGGRKVAMPDEVTDVVRASGVRWSEGPAGGGAADGARGGDFSLVFPRA